ncbi:MAG: TonB-dependent receptor [Paracoccaceae bacterium]
MTLLRSTLLLGTALAPGFAGLPALAQEIIALDEITISANLEETALNRSGATVEVVTEDDLQNAGDTRVADFLETLPGVSLRMSGPIGTTATLYLRGAPAQYVPVFVDGIELGDPAAGQQAFDFGTLSTTDISRIEVLKGSNSAVYGSQAVAGAINITTKRAQDIGTEQAMAAEFGSYATRKLSYSYATKTDKGEIALTASHLSTDGFSARDENDGNFEADGYRANRLSFYADYQLAPALKLGVNGFIEDSRGEFDDFAGDVAGTPGDDYTLRDSKGARAFAEFAAGAFEHTLEATYFQSDRVSCSNGWCDPFLGTRNKISWQGATDLGLNGRIVFGADSEQEKAHGAATRTNGVFTELSYALGDALDLTASARHDTHSDFGGFTSGRLAAVYRISDDLLLRASVGNGFRAPSLYELHGPYGDAGLKREESRSAEIGVEKRFGDLGHLRLTAFQMRAKNLIGWDSTAIACGSGFGCYNQVDGSSQRKGLELSGAYQIAPKLRLGGSYTYTDSSVSTGWAAVARHDLSLFADYAMTDALSTTLSVQHVADRPSGMADYTLANLGLGYEFAEGKRATLRIENLFDSEYQLNSGYGTSDRAIYVGIGATF